MPSHMRNRLPSLLFLSLLLLLVSCRSSSHKRFVIAFSQANSAEPYRAMQKAMMTRLLASQPDVFMGVLTEKLLTYALGRGTQYFDMPAVRGIVQEARDRDYRFSGVVLGIVESTPFQMKTKAETSHKEF